MPKTSLAEWVLKRAAGSERGTAIYGDLVELAATRSRKWFWLAYSRTVLALTWRTGLAFLAGCLSQTILLSAFQWWDSLTHERTQATFGLVFAFVGLGLLPAALMMTVMLFTPYAVIRYGLRDRMGRLAGLIFLLEATSFLCDSLNVLCFAPPAVLLVAFCLKGWRRPAAILTATVLICAAVFQGLLVVIALGSVFIKEHLPHPHVIYKTQVPWNAVMVAIMLLMVFACSFLRRRFLTERTDTAAA